MTKRMSWPMAGAPFKLESESFEALLNSLGHRPIEPDRLNPPMPMPIGLTPNILHGALARQALEHFQGGPVDAMTALGFWVVRRLGSVPWTEYSLYTSVAELKGNLFDYHVHWDPCYFHDTQLFSEHTCVWGAVHDGLSPFSRTR